MTGKSLTSMIHGFQFYKKNTKNSIINGQKAGTISPQKHLSRPVIKEMGSNTIWRQQYIFTKIAKIV